MPLQSTVNTPAVERRIRHAAREILGRRRLSVDYEHGQWWATSLDSGARWSVVDAAGGRSVDGFDFEQIEHSEED